MGISLRASASQNNDTVASTYTASKPTGTASGDVLLAFVGCVGSTISFTPPSGWTQIGSTEAGTTTMRTAVWYKVAGGSEPSTYSWALGGGFKGFLVIAAFEGVDTTTPIDAHSSGDQPANTTSAASSLTIGSAGAWLWSVVMDRHAFGAQTIATSDGSDHNEYSHGSTSGSGFDYAGAAWDSNRDLTSGSASRTFTGSGTANMYSWWLVSLKPAGGGTLKARLYQSALTAPTGAAPLRARLYQSSLRAPAAGGGLKARLYQSSLRAPLPAGAKPRSGLYIAKGGNTQATAVYVDTAGQVE